MIRGEWAASAGTVVEQSQQGAACGDPATAQYAQATLQLDSTGAGTFTTPIMAGMLSHISMQFVDMVAGAALTVTDSLGANLVSTIAPSGGGARASNVNDSPGSNTPQPISERLTVTVAGDLQNASKKFVIRVYLNPSGS